MSECVVRMERVPKDCDDGCWGSLSGECPWCESIDGYKMVGNRPPNCPIITVLPDGHGRLVDADALLGILQKIIDKPDNFVMQNMAIATARIIEEAATIAPAEPPKEDV